MSIFKEMLKEGQSLFRDSIPLDYDFLPKVLKFREKEQKQFALAIKPLLQERSGRNLFVYGAPGIGKTAACRHVLKELEEETDDVIPIYINCWKHNTTFKMLIEICNQLGIKLITNQKTSELFDRIKTTVNKRAAVFVFDEIDKIEDFDVLYTLLEDIYKKSIFLITNYREKVEHLDERIASRLNPEFVEFKPYNAEETKGILAERMKYAFVPGVWNSAAFEKVAEKAAKTGDIRQGLFIMREAGNIAEERASTKIEEQHVAIAISKADEFSIKKHDELDADVKDILALVKKYPNLKMGDLFQKFLEHDGNMSYKTFSRKIEKLAKGKFVTAEKVTSHEGNTTIINIYGEKKLTEF